MNGCSVASAGVRAPVTLLRPGNQKRLQQLRQALARQHVEPLLGSLPMAGTHLALPQQELRGLALGQFAGKLHRLGTARDQAGNERLLQQFPIVGLAGQRTEELGRRGRRIRLAHGEPPHQVAAEDTRRCLPGLRHRHPGGGRIGCRAGRQQGEGEKKRATSATDVLHPLSLLQLFVRVMRI